MNTYRALFAGGIGAILMVGCAPASGEAEEGSLTLEANAIAPSTPFDGDPKNGAVYALDVSMWEGPISQREMDCFWESGVRHIVAGTQIEEITRQQLAMAVSRGMTVDAYVYLYWDRDMTAQVKEAFRRVEGFPIGRLWLDVEEDPKSLGWTKVVSLVKGGLETCASIFGSADGCGIYTGPGFWKTHMNNTSELGTTPLWYAQYNARRTLDAWSVERFGGWSKPAAKQWAEEALCGVGVDKNSMQVVGKPAVVIDRSLPPDDGLLPGAPGGLYPGDGSVVSIDVVKLMSATIPRATSYQLALERWDATARTFRPYYTWSNADPFVKTYPPLNALYRMRVRAKNARGFGAWSAWSTFDYGKYAGTRPGAAPAPTTPPSEPAEPAETVAGAPASLAPNGGTLSTAAVTLSFAAVVGALRYEIAIENANPSGSFVPYVTYTTTTTTKTYYPAIHRTKYRFRARASVSGTMGAWSPWASFDYE